jgi:hypothetical protein
MRYDGKVIAPHPCESQKFCSNGRSVFGKCRFHSVQGFNSDPQYVVAFKKFVEKRNGQEAKPRFGAAE